MFNDVFCTNLTVLIKWSCVKQSLSQRGHLFMTCKIKHRVFQRSSFSLYLASFALVARCNTNVVAMHFLGFLLHSSDAYYYYLLMFHAPHPFSEMNEWLHALWFHLSSSLLSAPHHVFFLLQHANNLYTSTHHLYPSANWLKIKWLTYF